MIRFNHQTKIRGNFLPKSDQVKNITYGFVIGGPEDVQQESESSFMNEDESTIMVFERLTNTIHFLKRSQEVTSSSSSSSSSSKHETKSSFLTSLSRLAKAEFPLKLSEEELHKRQHLRNETLTVVRNFFDTKVHSIHCATPMTRRVNAELMSMFEDNKRILKILSSKDRKSIEPVLQIFYTTVLSYTDENLEIIASHTYDWLESDCRNSIEQSIPEKALLPGVLGKKLDEQLAKRFSGNPLLSFLSFFVKSTKTSLSAISEISKDPKPEDLFADLKKKVNELEQFFKILKKVIEKTRTKIDSFDAFFTLILVLHSFFETLKQTLTNSQDCETSRSSIESPVSEQALHDERTSNEKKSESTRKVSTIFSFWKRHCYPEEDQFTEKREVELSIMVQLFPKTNFSTGEKHLINKNLLLLLKGMMRSFRSKLDSSFLEKIDKMITHKSKKSKAPEFESFSKASAHKQVYPDGLAILRTTVKENTSLNLLASFLSVDLFAQKATILQDHSTLLTQNFITVMIANDNLRWLAELLKLDEPKTLNDVVFYLSLLKEVVVMRELYHSLLIVSSQQVLREKLIWPKRGSQPVVDCFCMKTFLKTLNLPGTKEKYDKSYEPLLVSRSLTLITELVKCSELIGVEHSASLRAQQKTPTLLLLEQYLAAIEAKLSSSLEPFLANVALETLVNFS